MDDMKETSALSSFAHRCRWARALRGLTREELADQAGISAGVIWNTEGGRNKTIRKIAAVAKALDVDPLWLAEGVGSPTPDAQAAPAPGADAETRMVLDWLAVWRGADMSARSLIESAFDVARSQAHQAHQDKRGQRRA